MQTAAAFQPVDRCWVCGHDQFNPFHRCAFDLSAFATDDPELEAYTGARLWLRRCGRCGFGQPEALPALVNYFDRMYDQQWSEDWLEHEFESRSKDLIFRGILEDLRPRVPAAERRLLDVGTHVGKFLYQAAEDGWRVEGIELNPWTAAYATRRTGAVVHRLNLDAFLSTGRRFDAVTLIDVLEHIPEPVRMLRRIRPLLVPGGWIAVKVPCGSGQLLKERVRAALRPGYRIELATNLVHVNHFGSGSLMRALEAAGFEQARVKTAAPELSIAVGSRLRVALDDGVRRVVYASGRWLPGAMRSRLALNLLAYGRAGARDAS